MKDDKPGEMTYALPYHHQPVARLRSDAGGGGAPNRAPERQIEQAAPRYLGPADRYVAEVSGLTASSARQVRLTGYGVRPTPGQEQWARYRPYFLAALNIAMTFSVGVLSCTLWVGARM